MLWWIFAIVAVQALFSVAAHLAEVAAYRSLDGRITTYEAVLTERIDVILNARVEQKQAQELQQAYGVPARNSRPVMSRPFVPSRPRTTLPPNLPPLDEWEGWASRQNGQIHAAEWNS